MEGLGACGIDAVVEEETDDTLTEIGRSLAPRPMPTTLRQGGKEVQEVQTDNEEIIEQAQYLVLAKSNKMTLAQCNDGANVLRMSAKDTLGLEKPGSRQMFYNSIMAVITNSRHRQTATHKEKELITGIALAHHSLPYRQFLEAELGLSGQL